MLLLVWRRRGPLGKLHNLIYWCVRSPQRNERLMALQQTLVAPFRPNDKKSEYELVKDVTTRWNSFDDAAARALYLRPALDELMMEVQLEHDAYVARCHQSRRLVKKQAPAILADRLDNGDWNIITLYHDILAPVKKATMELQGHAGRGRFGAIWQVIPVHEDLVAHFEQLRDRYPVNEALLHQSQQ